MKAVILFTSLTWNKEVWGKNHYLCDQVDSMRSFNGYHFTTNKTKALIMPLNEASRLASDISTRATVAVI